MKTWEEMTKLNKTEKLVLNGYIFIIIVSIIMAILDRNIVWLIVVTLSSDLAVTEYWNIKIRNGKDEIMNLQDQAIKSKDNFINFLLKKISKTKTIELDKIKIPQHFTKPKRKKLKDKLKYYNKYNCFESQIIIDQNNTLVDGYTSYLIAKDKRLDKVNVKLIESERNKLMNTISTYKGIINKKNKMINAMTDTISSLELGVQTINEQYKKQWCEFINSDEDCCWKTDKECKDCIKEYFERKVK